MHSVSGKRWVALLGFVVGCSGTASSPVRELAQTPDGSAQTGDADPPPATGAEDAGSSTGADADPPAADAAAPDAASEADAGAIADAATADTWTPDAAAAFIYGCYASVGPVYAFSSACEVVDAGETWYPNSREAGPTSCPNGAACCTREVDPNTNTVSCGTVFRCDPAKGASQGGCP